MKGFCSRYKPNSEQAGYRKGQVCVIQLFGLLIIIHYVKCLGKDVFIGLLDFEKAFDYTNRELLIKRLITDSIGKKMIGAIKNMYLDTIYVSKLSVDRIEDEIISNYGVAQGRKSSANLFSYYISDMADCLQNLPQSDYMDPLCLQSDYMDPLCLQSDYMNPLCLQQLADYTNLLAESIQSLGGNFSALYEYSKRRYQYINRKKMKYMHVRFS